MYPLFSGIGWGLVLSIMIGPILFALIQAGIEHGFKEGVLVGLGVWVSDLLFIIVIYWGLSFFVNITEVQNVETYLGIGGGIVLLFAGFGTLFSPPPSFELDKTKNKFTNSNIAFWLKGFLINTINPFTIFFWISVMTTTILGGNMNGTSAFLFFAGVLGTIICTDLLKVYLAKRVRAWLKPNHILKVRQISGLIFILFGFGFMIWVLFQ